MSFSASLQRGPNFQSQDNATILAGAASVAVQMYGSGTDFLFENNGSVEVFVVVGGSDVLAVAGGGSTTARDGSLAVPAGGVLLVNFTSAINALRGGPVFVAAVTATGTAVVRIAQGTGSTAVAKAAGGTSTVSGTVSISGGTVTLGATANVAGTVTALPNGTTTVAGTVTALPSGVETVTGTVTLGAAASVVGTVTALPSGTTTVSGNVSITGTPTVSVSGGTVTLGGGTVSISGTSTVTGTVSVAGTSTVSGTVSVASIAAGSNLIGGVPLSLTIANPSSTLQATAATTGYSANTMIGNSSIAGSVTVPSFTVPTVSGGAGGVITRLRMQSSDTVTTGWPGQTVQVALYTGLPTVGSGDRAAYSIAGGSAQHLGDFSGTFGAMEGDGSSARLTPNNGNFDVFKLSSGATVYWVPLAVSGTGTTGASAVFTLVAEIFY